MKDENALIGLFQGIFDGNIHTVNPGLDENANNNEDSRDIRDIQKVLKNSGIPLIREVEENTEGATSIVLTDPDRNMILIDQHR